MLELHKDISASEISTHFSTVAKVISVNGTESNYLCALKEVYGNKHKQSVLPIPPMTKTKFF